MVVEKPAILGGFGDRPYDKSLKASSEDVRACDRVIGLLQRVSGAHVVVGDRTIARIAHGLLVLVGVERGDAEREADRLLERLLGYRVFSDAQGRMNRSVRDVSGGLLMVPQFTLAADTTKGTRPGFSTAASPAEGERLYGYLTERARQSHPLVESGRFGADMKVTLTNDGPVTFWLHVKPGAEV
jgi:D-tyrosyl-tRNA(Tyr) deacylase